MDKRTLLNEFQEDEKVEVSNLYEKYSMSYNKDISLFGGSFYPPNIWSFFERKLSTKNFEIQSFGFFNDAERRMISFNNIYNIEFPMKILKVVGTSKFTNLTHKDFLGAILALGIKRNKLGDLVLKDGICYLAVVNEMAEYIIENLVTVGRSPCRVEEVNNIEPFGGDFKEEVILVPSLRVDAVVSKITNLSRGKSQSLIEGGKVLLNYIVIKDNSKEVSFNDRISIRGFGKFTFGECIGNSKSGKFKVLIKKYT